MNVELKPVRCKRCGYQWVPRKADVRVCPKCKSPYWDRTKTVKLIDEYHDHPTGGITILRK